VPEKSYEIKVPKTYKDGNKNEAGAATRVAWEAHP
jgi:hypothetical protein